MIRRLLAGLLLVATAASAADPLEWVMPEMTVHAARGTDRQLVVSLMNTTSDPLFLLGVSHAPPAGFDGTLTFDEFLLAAPDTLFPGQTWTGPVGHLTRPPGPSDGIVHRLDIGVLGGVHRYDDQLLAGLAFFVDDSSDVLAVDTLRLAPLARALDIEPNPVRDVARIRLIVPTAGRVTLTVVDVAGRARARLLDALLPPGERELRWEGRDDAGQRLAPGVYFLRLVTPNGTKRARLVRID